MKRLRTRAGQMTEVMKCRRGDRNDDKILHIRVYDKWQLLHHIWNPLVGWGAAARIGNSGTTGPPAVISVASRMFFGFGRVHYLNKKYVI